MTKQFLLVSMMLLAVMLGLVSCSPDKVLPSKDGKWNFSNGYTTTTSITGISDQVNSGTTSGTVTFTETTVTFTANGSSETYSWSYTDDKIVLKEGSATITYTVESSSNKKQEWHRDETSSQTLLGITTSIRYVEHLTLTR